MSDVVRDGRRRWIATVLLTASFLGIVAVAASHRFGSVSNALAWVRGERILVDARVKSLGEIEVGGRRTVAFTVTNLAGKPITVLGASTTCSCTVVVNLPMSIASGSTRTIEVDVHASDRPGKLAEFVDIITDVSGEIRCGVTADIVRSELAARPGTNPPVPVLVGGS